MINIENCNQTTWFFFFSYAQASEISRASSIHKSNGVVERIRGYMTYNDFSVFSLLRILIK